VSKKRQEMERILEWFQKETGKEDWDMEDVARFAMSKGMKLPEPEDPIKRLARQFSEVARAKIKHDEETGMPYRAYHSFKQKQGAFVWFDSDVNVPRAKMHKSLAQLRNQTIGDCLQISFDEYHWNRTHPAEEPINIPMDFTEDVLERMSIFVKEQQMKKAG